MCLTMYFNTLKIDGNSFESQHLKLQYEALQKLQRLQLYRSYCQWRTSQTIYRQHPLHIATTSNKSLFFSSHKEIQYNKHYGKLGYLINTKQTNC